ncbi:MAG: peptidyl-prolyl cis-trans isomerase [Flavobacteriales bacterium]|nr:peptidyl-prolyl cis-trans isomerase [Flavobacteriales bacterium]
MIKAAPISVHLLALVLMSSCGFFSNDIKQDGKLLARVGNKYLYSTDIQGAIPLGTDSLDSLTMVNKHVNNWVEKELILQKADLNLSSEQKDFTKQIEDYKNSLITYAYEQELIRQKLDTNVSDEEIDRYYKANPDNFQLKRYIVKVKMIKVDREAPKIGKVKDWVASEDPDDFARLEEYCLQFSSLCLLEDNWMFFDELTRLAPIRTIDVEQYLKNNKFVEIEGEQFLYFMYFYDYRLKNSLSPIELEYNRIKNVIVNKRKLLLLSNLRQDLQKEAMNNNMVEYFIK